VAASVLIIWPFCSSYSAKRAKEDSVVSWREQRMAVLGREVFVIGA